MRRWAGGRLVTELPAKSRFLQVAESTFGLEPACALPVVPDHTAIAFRALTRADFPSLQRWLNSPHVYAWWGRQAGPGALGGAGPDAATKEQIEVKYGPEVDGLGITHRFIIEFEGASIGLIQWYRLRDFTDYARAMS